MKLPALWLRLFAHEKDGIFDEVKGHGYEPIRLDSSIWNESEGRGHYPPQNFDFTGPAGWVRGWYVTNHGGKVWQYCPFEAVEVKSYGDRLTIECEYSIVGQQKES